MKHFRILLSLSALSLLVFLSSCSEKKEVDISKSYGDKLFGLASPVRLNHGSTTIYLQDYFSDPSFVEKVIVCGDEYTVDTIAYTVMIDSISCNTVDRMSVTYDGVRHDIPVFASEKVEYEFRYLPSSDKIKEVSIAGNINGWNPSATELTKEGEEFVTTLILDPAVYEYQMVEDGEWKLDPNNPEKKDNGQGGWNSVMKVGETEMSARCWLDSYDGNKFVVRANDNMNLLAFYEDMSLEIEKAGENAWNLRLPHHFDSLPEKAMIRVYSYKGSRRGNDLAIPVINNTVALDPAQLDRHDYKNNIMYFAMVDRFFDGDSTNNHPTPDGSIHEKANHHGGDLIGLAKKVREGYLDSLGVNALWISPITQNPEGAYGLWDKGITSTFSAYHGYWPVSSTKVDYRFGTEEDLSELIAALHEEDMNIFLDYVANHVHEEHPIYQQHPDWATDLYLPDGSLNTERWDEHRLTTWFDTFLPTLDLSRPEVVEPMTDSAMFWIENYELDGLRHDATKHIPELFWRTLTLKVKKYLMEHPERSLLQIGETYGNPELIASYIGSGMMDSQFDFNLYDAAVDAFAKEDTDFENLKRVLKESLHAYGSHHTMGNITGNQDRARFISYADGGVKFDEDPKLAGWIRDIEHMNEEGFPKIQMLTSFLMSVPGIPCIYYGDEIGMPGGNDPDNRRMMHFDDWTAQESATFANARDWVNYRKNSMALLYGETYFLPSSANSLVICRRYFDDVTLSVFVKDNNEAEVEISLDPSITDLNWEVITGQDLSKDGTKLRVEMDSWSSALIRSVK